MISRRINILWVDDDLVPRNQGNTPQRTRLQPWLRWFRSREADFRVIGVNALDALADALQRAHAKKPGDAEYLDALLVDIMWREGTGLSGNFGRFGFPKESILPLDGGAQFLGLLLNAQYQDHSNRPAWFCCPPQRKVAALTTLVSAVPTTEAHLDHAARARVSVLEKEVRDDPHTGLLAPNESFIRWCEGLLALRGVTP